MSSIFNSIPVPKKGRTNFNLSHSLSGTFGLGYCTPVFLRETIPGDIFDIDVYNLTKLETLIAPAMQQIDASLLWFKIPKRLCYKYFKDWYTGGSTGEFSGEKPHIYLSAIINNLYYEFNTKYGNHAKFNDICAAVSEEVFGPGSLWNYLGLPIPLYFDTDNNVWKVLPLNEMTDFIAETIEDDAYFIDMMPFIAYNMLYDCYFMDQTLNDRVFVDCEIGNLTINHKPGKYRFTVTAGLTSYYVDLTFSDEDIAEGGTVSLCDFLYLNRLFKRAWRKDYFTSALPSPQRGPEVKINMFDGQTAPVSGHDVDFNVIAQNMGGAHEVSMEQEVLTAHDMDPDNNSTRLMVLDNSSTPVNLGLDISKNAGLTADMSALSPMAITAFRNLFKLQAFLEKNNVAGGRFIETILAHWAERVPDFTVQRPVHLRSTSIPIQISEVTATANSSGVNSQVGDQGGRAKTTGNLGKLHVYTHEPCFIIGLFCVTPPPSYANQGIDRMWQRITRFDEPWRDFQHIGEQAIKARELVFDWENAEDLDQDFGYQQRFSEFKYMPNRVVGDFQTSLSYWHMARMFDSVPTLNGRFITCEPDERIFAVQSARPVFADFFFKIRLKSKLSKFSTPKLT